jgi:hypothetical protein
MLKSLPAFHREQRRYRSARLVFVAEWWWSGELEFAVAPRLIAPVLLTTKQNRFHSWQQERRARFAPETPQLSAGPDRDQFGLSRKAQSDKQSDTKQLPVSPRTVVPPFLAP